jgi:predicted acylesterase/phospholipase RssA
MSPSAPSGAATLRATRESQRAADIAQAQAILRGKDADAPTAYELAERLKTSNEFGYARRLYGHIRSVGEYTALKAKASVAKVGQRHALCTYKDPDLPAADRFDWALKILDEVDNLKLTPAEQQESLGLRGAVYKRIWQQQGQFPDLVRSGGYYLQGYAMGPQTDQGYTGINAAFVLDLLAREGAIEAARTGSGWDAVEAQHQRAQEIRQILTKVLPDLPVKAGNEWLKKEWWFYTTRAEAHFGLGDYEAGLVALRGFNRAVGLTHEGPPLEALAPWEFESTITQFSALIQVQADLAEQLARRETGTSAVPSPGEALRQRASHALRSYLGDYAPGVDRVHTGKVGLALSGGGFRASLFHIGVLAHLAERDILRHVEVLSCVSGGSIVGAYYYLEIKRLLEEKPDGQLAPRDYAELVQRVEKDFLAGVQTNIRCRVLADIWCNLRMFFQPSYTTTRRLGELYESLLYARVADGCGHGPRHLRDLLVRPKGEGPEFKPKYDNWRRADKVPTLVLNATTLNTGHNWQFTGSWMGEPPSSLDAEIEGNYRLRRMYHDEAPRREDKWATWFRRPFAPPDYQRFRLGDAVAASSSVPGLFEPLVLPDLYDGKTIRLVDGGVYDNQGIASILEQDCTVLIVSDASGQMDALDHPSGGRLGVPLRSFSVSMARVRQSQFEELAARRRSGLLKGLVFLHLKKGLDADPVDWRECQDPHDASDLARPAEARGPLVPYGLQKSVQRLISAIRTDLDSFTEVEAFALMTSGYRQAELGTRSLTGFPAATAPADGWRFLQIEPALSPGPGFDDLTRQLRIGSFTPGKAWLLSPPLTVLGIAMLLVAVAGLGWLWSRYRAVTLLTVGSLGMLVAGLAVATLWPHVVRLIRWRSTFRDVGLRSLGAAVAAIGFKAHLALIDPIFLRRGRLSRLLARRQGRAG